MTKEYLLASTVGIDWGPLDVGGIHYFRRHRADRFFTLELKDATGMPVPAIVYQYLKCCAADRTSPDSFDRRDICGGIEQPVRLAPETVGVSVALQAGRCKGRIVVPTRGTVSVSFRS